MSSHATRDVQWEIDIVDDVQGPYHIVLEKENFWYVNGDEWFEILDSGKLMDEIAALVNDKFDIVSQGDSSIDTETATAAAIIEQVEADKASAETIGGNIVSKLNSQLVTIDSDQAEMISATFSSISEDNTHFNIQLPLDSAIAELIDGVVIAKDRDLDYRITTEILEGGIRNCFIIEKPDSPELYPVSYAFDESVVFEYSVDDYGKRDGSVCVRNNSGESVAFISPPWATDSNGNALDTHYVIENTTVTQVVEHKGKDVSYPIIADPTIGIYFSNYKWEYVSAYKGWSLRLYPSTAFINLLQQPARSALYAPSWAAVYNACHSNSHWINTNSMKGQYDCHLTWAPTKTYYGIDAWRPYVSALQYYVTKCNP
jgi:hypothetical protein